MKLYGVMIRYMATLWMYREIMKGSFLYVLDPCFRSVVRAESRLTHYSICGWDRKD